MPQNDNEGPAGKPAEVELTQVASDREKAVENKSEAAKEAAEEKKQGCCDHKITKFYLKHSFLINAVLAILLALANPPFAENYLAPKVTAGWVAVIFIFIMSGLSLKTKEIKKALSEIGFNVFVQLFNLGVVPVAVFGVSRLLVHLKALHLDLADGMVVAASLPMTVNMVIVLTKSSGGDEACALLNASLGNLLGVFVTPALLLLYLG